MCLPHFSTFEVGPFNEPRAHQLANQVGQSSPLVAASPELGLETCATVGASCLASELVVVATLFRCGFR